MNITHNLFDWLVLPNHLNCFEQKRRGAFADNILHHYNIMKPKGHILPKEWPGSTSSPSCHMKLPDVTVILGKCQVRNECSCYTANTNDTSYPALHPKVKQTGAL